MPLNYVPPDQLGAKWEFVEQGLNEILRRCPDTWTPRIIKGRLLANRAKLFCGEDGFFIVEQCEDIHNLAIFLNVWCMYFLPGRARKDELLQQLDELARHFACEYIQFTSPRTEWVRAMRGDFEEHAVILRRKKQ